MKIIRSFDNIISILIGISGLIFYTLIINGKPFDYGFWFGMFDGVILYLIYLASSRKKGGMAVVGLWWHLMLLPFIGPPATGAWFLGKGVSFFIASGLEIQNCKNVKRKTGS